MIKWLLKLFKKKERITTKKAFRLGALQDPLDTRDHITGYKPIGILPSIVNLSTYASEVRQQGSANSCTAYSAVAVYEMESRINREEFVEGSEQYNYYNSRILNGLFPDDKGSYLREAFKVIHDFGDCPEKLMPYNDKDINYNPGIFCGAFARFFRIKEYLRILSVPGIKESLNQNHPVSLAIPVTEAWIGLTKDTIPAYDNKVVGGHAIYIIGYDDNKVAFMIQNSWGKNWADKGRAWLPYSYVYDCPWFDCWTIRI